MVVEELLLYFLVVPAMGYAGAAFLVRRTMRMIAEHQLGFLRDTGATSKFFVFLALFATPIVFGLVLFIQASQPALETPVSGPVLRTMGWAYSIAAVLTLLSEAWIVVRWKAASFREMFARVLILMVIPEVVIVWSLNISLLVLGVVQHGPAEPPLDQASADALSRSVAIMMVGAFAAPLVAFLVTRFAVLNHQNFRKILLTAVAGIVPAAVCLIIAITQIPRS